MVGKFLFRDACDESLYIFPARTIRLFRRIVECGGRIQAGADGQDEISAIVPNCVSKAMNFLHDVS